VILLPIGSNNTFLNLPLKQPVAQSGNIIVVYPR
jgi:hypothetical protein